MIEISDEELMSFADGELAPERHRFIETMISADPDLARRLEAFLATGPNLARALDGVLDLPVPQNLIETIMTAPGFAARVPAAETASQALPRRAKRSRVAEFFTFLGPSGGFALPLAAAFSTVLVVGTAAGWVLHQKSLEQASAAPLLSVAEGGVTASGPLAVALNTAASGVVTTSGSGQHAVAIKPVFSFSALDGSVCRQYEVRPALGAAVDGLACREAAGRWRVEMITKAQGSASAGDRMAAADGASQMSVIDAAVDRIISGNVFTRSAEEEAMRRGWTVEQKP